MTPRRIKNQPLTAIQLRRKQLMLMSGKSARWVAAQLGLHEGTISAVLRDRSRSVQVEVFLSKLWGVDRVEVFPDGPLGEPKAELDEPEIKATKLALREYIAKREAAGTTRRGHYYAAVRALRKLEGEDT